MGSVLCQVGGRDWAKRDAVDHVIVAIGSRHVVNVDPDSNRAKALRRLNLLVDPLMLGKRLDDADSWASVFNDFSILVVRFHPNPVENAKLFGSLNFFLHGLASLVGQNLI